MEEDGSPVALATWDLLAAERDEIQKEKLTHHGTSSDPISSKEGRQVHVYKAVTFLKAVYFTIWNTNCIWGVFSCQCLNVFPPTGRFFYLACFLEVQSCGLIYKTFVCMNLILNSINLILGEHRRTNRFIKLDLEECIYETRKWSEKILMRIRTSEDVHKLHLVAMRLYCNENTVPVPSHTEIYRSLDHACVRFISVALWDTMFRAIN